MPIKHAAKKALRKAHKKEAINKDFKKNLSFLERKFLKFVQEKKAKEAKEFFLKLQKQFDKGSQKGILKKNMVSRKKSRLAKKLNLLDKK